MTAELRLLDAAADYGLCPMPTPDQELHSMLSWIRMKNQVPKSRLPFGHSIVLGFQLMYIKILKIWLYNAKLSKSDILLIQLLKAFL